MVLTAVDMRGRKHERRVVKQGRGHLGGVILTQFGGGEKTSKRHNIRYKAGFGSRSSPGISLYVPHPTFSIISFKGGW